MCSARERFCAVLSSGPLLKGDVIVVLAGDGTKRLDTALQVFKQSGAPLVCVSGALDNPPHSLMAKAARTYLIEAGLAPDRIRISPEGQNTHDEALAVLAMAAEEEWKRLIIVTSPYHMPRAFLTYLSVLLDDDVSESVCLTPCPASQTPWWEDPEGMQFTRITLLESEYQKIDEYGEKRHVASYEDGLEYLKHWEGLL